MINCTVKLKPTAGQERQLRRWLWHLTAVWNWSVRKIELDAADRVYHSKWEIKAMLNGHGRRMGIPVDVLTETAADAHRAWRDCFKGIRRRPRLKGMRRRLNSMVFRHGRYVKPVGRRIAVGAFGSFAFHKQAIPVGKIKRLRVVRRASGWYGVLTIDADPLPIAPGAGEVGIDPGFSNLLTLSTGEKIDRPTEIARITVRLAQAQRGRRRRLAARLLERTASQRRNRNHQLSRRLVSENKLIAWSKDRHSAIAHRFGKSVQSSGHGQLRQMLAYKCRPGGAQFIEVASRNSTRACSACSDLTGPTGWRGLKVRQWVCPTCGVEHDRDVNAAVNTLNAGLGISLESGRKAASGIATTARRRRSLSIEETPAERAQS